jgi:hypothetical protein
MGRHWLVSDEDARVRFAGHRVAEAAEDTMPRKIQVWTEKSELMIDCLAGSNANQAKVQRAMSVHMSDHIDFWKQKRKELQVLTNDRSDDPQSLFERLLTLIRRAGIHAHHIQEPLKELGTKMQEYVAECKRFRLT